MGAISRGTYCRTKTDLPVYPWLANEDVDFIVDDLAAEASPDAPLLYLKRRTV